MTSFRWGSATDVGQVRQNNQDSLLATETLFVVADGMGGHRGGEVASAVAVEAVQNRYAPGASVDDLVDAVREANEAVVARADEEPELRGMGTTLTGLALVVADGEERLGIVNVGDSRLYLLKRDALDQITDDHSLVATLVRQGQLTAAEAEEHPHRNILTRALGIEPTVQVDTWELLPFAGDRYLLCSDGLFNEVSEDEIARVLRDVEDPDDAASQLVAMANEGGGRDNITVLIVDVEDDDGRAAAMDTDGEEGDEPDRVAKATAGNDPVLVEASARPASEQAEDREGGVTDTSVPATDSGTRTRFTWRVAAFVIGTFLVLAVATFAVVTMASNTSHVAYDGDEVVIFRGPPGGMLWIDASVEQRTGMQRDEVPAQFQGALEEGRETPTLEHALAFVANLQEVAANAEAADLGAAIGQQVPATSSTVRSPGSPDDQAP